MLSLPIDLPIEDQIVKMFQKGLWSPSMIHKYKGIPESRVEKIIKEKLTPHEIKQTNENIRYLRGGKDTEVDTRTTKILV